MQKVMPQGVKQQTFQPADHLHSRTFIGLLIAQFLAAFNDQAIHASAMFYAFNTQTLTESQAITLMPILFYAPWAIFCTIAGYLADKYSKRNALIIWKIVEVAVTLFALLGFWLGRQEGHASLGTWIVLSCVFLMGMHSAFFVPAKYGVMPEILTPRMLSKGNGALESLSFLAVILGTVAGGVFSTIFRGEEYKIGIVLVVLAVVGALASFLIRKMPAANPMREFPAYIYGPLMKNIGKLLTSRPLIFAVVGIAFFTFLVAYMRQVVYMHGQSQQPPWSEAYTSIIVGMVALGIGIGSPLAGYLSGGKVEVGLVPVGAAGMVLATSVAAIALFNVPVLVVCIILIGFFTGFYLVPLFSLIQHRAPKASKGDSIATSNFINITGAIAASLVFFSLDTAAKKTGFVEALQLSSAPIEGKLEGKPEYESGHPHKFVVSNQVFEASKEPDLLDQLRRDFIDRKAEQPTQIILIIDSDIRFDPMDDSKNDVVVRKYQRSNVTYYSLQPAHEKVNPIYDKQTLPKLLFLGTGAMTLLTLLLLWFLLPDLLRRSGLWLRGLPSYHMELAGMLRLPGEGPAVIVTDAPNREALSHVVRAADRVAHIPNTMDNARRILSRRRVLLLAVETTREIDTSGPAGPEEERHAAILVANDIAEVLPVHHAQIERDGRCFVYVVAGHMLPPRTPLAQVRAELRRIREEVERRIASGAPLEVETPEH